MPNPANVKISDVLSLVIEGDSAPITREVVQVEHIKVALCQFVSMLRIVLHE
jgi:hypothetical protein